jgi:tetratricopeptide (TPR) repeat protein
MYNIIPLIIILFSLASIITILVRKFPALANLDMETIKAEQETKFKEQILGNRLKRGFSKWTSRLFRLLRPLGTAIGSLFAGIYHRLNELKENYKNDNIVEAENAKLRISSLFLEAEELERKDDLEGAEKRLIEIIGIESKNVRAFKELAQIYVRKKDYEEAKQALEHLLRLLDSEEDEVAASGAVDKGRPFDYNLERSLAFYYLSSIHESLGNIDAAFDFINKSLQIEPNNPKHLDTLLEISIMKKDKVSALDAYQRLEKVNPENQKLPELKESIKDL